MESQDVLEALKKMPLTDLRKVSAQATHLLTKGVLNTSPLERDVYESICDALKLEGVSSLPPFTVFARTNTFASFRRGVILFLEYIEQYCKPKKRLERMKIIHVFLRMLVRRLRRDGVPLSSKTMASALLRVENIVEDQFPGYRESGLLPILLKKYQLR